MINNSNSNSVRIVEVGPRDGLQNVKNSVATETKVELIERLYGTGLRSIELTSFVSPKAVPQLADCQRLLADSRVKSLQLDESLRAPVLVPNLKGLEAAIKSGVKEVAVFVSASEGFSQSNIKCSVEEGLQRASAVSRRARSLGLAVRGYVSSVIACPFDGKTPGAAVLRCVQRLLGAGCYEVSLGDTLGVGVASQVKGLLHYLMEAGISPSQLAGHFHDTYGQAVANVWAAYECGLRVFDSSVAGLGGCPYAPGAKGNVATEDLVYTFDQAGIQTGVNLGALVETGFWISQHLSRPNESRAGNAVAIKNKTHPILTPHSMKSRPDTDRMNWHLCDQFRSSDDIQIHQSGASIKVTLNRPRNGNALTSSMIEHLTAFFEEAANCHPRISRIAIAANGKYFCTGMDLSREKTPVSKGQSTTDAQFTRLTRLFDAVAQAPQVTIACIQGPAFGGGVGLAFVCDVRLAVTKASMKLSEVRLGLCPATISKYVAREWGLAFFREAMLSGRPVSAAELAQLGAIARLTEGPIELSDTLDEYLINLKSSAPHASTMCKELVRLAWSEAGQPAQAAGIRKLFDDMMDPTAEAAYGVGQLQRGQKQIDWDGYLGNQQSRPGLDTSRPKL